MKTISAAIACLMAAPTLLLVQSSAAAARPPISVTPIMEPGAPKVVGRLRTPPSTPPDAASPVVSGPTQPPPLYTLIPACPGNDANTGTDGFCEAATQGCPPGELMYWVYTAPAGSQIGGGGWHQIGQRCAGPAEADAPAVVPAMTLEEFQRLPLPAGDANIEPPNGYTLINIETNVYADAEPTTLSTTLLGFPVQVRATPSRYSWDFGDGNRFGPHADEGAPYPALRITNTYREAGTYDITLTTHYTGEYSVAGGPWLPIPGEAQVASPPAQVQALAGRNRLVADSLP